MYSYNNVTNVLQMYVYRCAQQCRGPLCPKNELKAQHRAMRAHALKPSAHQPHVSGQIHTLTTRPRSMRIRPPTAQYSGPGPLMDGPFSWPVPGDSPFLPKDIVNLMLVSLRALPVWVCGGLLADLHQASPSAACAPAASVSASSCPGRRGRVGARSVARAVLGVLRRDGLCVLAMPRGSHVVCASGNLSHWIQPVKEKETDTPRKTPGGGTPRSNTPPTRTAGGYTSWPSVVRCCLASALPGSI